MGIHKDALDPIYPKGLSHLPCVIFHGVPLGTHRFWYIHGASAGCREKGGQKKDAYFKIPQKYAQTETSSQGLEPVPGIRISKLIFVVSSVDKCILYRKKYIFFNYVDSGVFLSPYSGEVNTEIKKLKTLDYDIKDKGYFNNYLGLNFKNQKYGTINLTQPHLMKEIIRYTKLKHSATTSQISAASSNILHLQ